MSSLTQFGDTIGIAVINLTPRAVCTSANTHTVKRVVSTSANTQLTE